jgi:hypothetical protein
MPNRLRIAVLAVALSAAGVPAYAAEIPVYGTKNFTPGGDTPAYFTHNVAAPTVRSEDWSAADQAAGPAAPAAAAEHVSQATARHHGKVAGNHHGGSHVASKAKGKSRASRATAAKPGKATRTASAAHARPAGSSHARLASSGKTRSTTHTSHATRHAAVKSSQRKG